VRNLILQILMLAGICFSQQSSPARRNDSPLLDQQRPSVYLTFAKYEKLPSWYGGDVVWLDIHNNTKWSIWSVGSPNELGGSGWCYSVAVATRDPCRAPIPPYWSCGDVGGVVGVEPGRTVRLAVPAKHLSPGLAIEIDIGFYWEHGSGGVRHIVSFGHSDLPEAVRAALPFLDFIRQSSAACTDQRGHLLDPPAISMPTPPSVPFIESILPPVPKLEPPSTQPKKKDRKD
jgi:hypothetical protein